MEMKLIKVVVSFTFIFAVSQHAFSQSSFVNLDFEEGIFIPILFPFPVIHSAVWNLGQQCPGGLAILVQTKSIQFGTITVP